MKRDAKDHVPSPDDPISPEEVAEAEALRAALDAGTSSAQGELADALSLLGSLQAAHAPRALDESAHRAIIDRALAQKAPPRRSGTVIRVAFGVSTIVAAAAAVVLVMRPPAARIDAPFLARSTQALIDEPLTRATTTARVDRIAAARAIEFRENQFAAWGVR